MRIRRRCSRARPSRQAAGPTSVPRAVPEAGPLPHLAAVPAQRQVVDGAVYGPSVAAWRDGVKA